MWGSELSLLWENPCAELLTSLWETVGMEIDYIPKAPILPFRCGFFFNFECIISFLVGSSLFCQ